MGLERAGVPESKTRYREFLANGSTAWLLPDFESLIMWLSSKMTNWKSFFSSSSFFFFTKS